jgi:hypothetical protein
MVCVTCSSRRRNRSAGPGSHQSPAGGSVGENTVTINLPSGTSDRYVELSFTADNVQNGAQVSELAIYAP